MFQNITATSLPVSNR